MITLSERKKARNILPCVAVHLGEAEGKSTLAKLFTPLDLEKTNELKISSHNWPWNMVGALCNLENIPKHCLKQIGTERTPQLRMQELKRASLLDLLFRTSGCFIRPSFVELSGEIIYELEQRLSVQLKSRCSLSRESNSLCSQQYGLTSDLICVV